MRRSTKVAGALLSATLFLTACGGSEEPTSKSSEKAAVTQEKSSPSPEPSVAPVSEEDPADLVLADLREAGFDFGEYAGGEVKNTCSSLHRKKPERIAAVRKDWIENFNLRATGEFRNTGEEIFDIMAEGCFTYGLSKEWAPPKPKPPVKEERVDGKLVTFGDGTYEVGVDIVPGTYHLARAQTRNCTIYRLGAMPQEGMRDVVRHFDFFSKGEEGWVLVMPEDVAFQSLDCGEWRKAS